MSPKLYPKIITSIIFLLISIFANAQTLTGNVKDKAGNPLPGETIRVQGVKMATVTDSLGTYRFDNLKEGDYTVSVSGIDIETSSAKVNIKAGKLTNADFVVNTKTKMLEQVNVTTSRGKNGIGQLRDVEGTMIFAGKKTEVLIPDSLDANTAQNNPRQILGRVPGMNFSETEGSGFPSNGIGLRGLNPTQSIEMNTRQNDYNIAGDVYGYPETYYTPPMEAIDRIEIIRGAASLQFGPQLGGVVNYLIKQPVDKPLEVEVQQTYGSFGLFNTFTSAGGTYKNLYYYGYVQYKNTEGWRPNSNFDALTGFAQLGYKFNEKWKADIEYSLLRNTIKMPGGLTDAEFNANPDQSTRSRNWITTPWNILAAKAEGRISDRTSISVLSSYMASQRDLVWKNEDGGPQVADSISTLTNQYVPREVEREIFNSSTNEVRLLTNYNIGKMNNSLAVGTRFFYGKMVRDEGGPGSTGSDFDMNLYGGTYENALNFTTTNAAIFAENIFRFGTHFSITPGFRLEYLHSAATGYITDTGGAIVNVNKSQDRKFPLGGTGLQYRFTKAGSLYANISQAYKPIDYSSLYPIGVASKVDPNLKDASGYNADFGWRATIHEYLNFDIGAFYLAYNNRIGLISLTGNNGNPYTYRTNVANSVNKGAESYIELVPIKIFRKGATKWKISLYNSLSYIDARYVSANPNLVDDNGGVINIKGNHVEYSPNMIERTGLTLGYKKLSVTGQYSYTGLSYGDANNTVSGNNSIVGIIPAYHVFDLSGTLKIRNYNFKAGVNNLLDNHYFTMRTDEYPGPGIIPALGRSFYVSVGGKF